MNSTLKGIIKLTRFDEYVWFVIVTTLLGAAAGGGTFGWQLIVALLANWLAVALRVHDQRCGRRRRRRPESRQDQSQSHFVQDDLAARGLHRVVCDGAPVGVVLRAAGADPVRHRRDQPDRGLPVFVAARCVSSRCPLSI